MTDHEILKALKDLVESRAVTGGTLGTLLEITSELEERDTFGDVKPLRRASWRGKAKVPFKRVSKEVAGNPTWVSEDWLLRIVHRPDLSGTPSGSADGRGRWVSPYVLEVQSFLPGGPMKGPRSLTLPHWHRVGIFGTLDAAHEAAIEWEKRNR